MPYRVDLCRIDVLTGSESDPATYRPLLDFAAEEPGEDATRAGPGPRVEHLRTWTKAKERVLEHLETLRHGARWQMGLSVSGSASIFPRGPGGMRQKKPEFSNLETEQLRRFSLEEVLAMKRNLQAARMEEVDHRHENIPF